MRFPAGAALVAMLVAAACSSSGAPREASDASAPDRDLEPAYKIVLDADVSDFAQATHVDLAAIIGAAADATYASLEHSQQITIDVSDDLERVIPEIGVGGFTHDSGYVSIYIDTSAAGDRVKNIRLWLPLVVVHELHHSSRIRTGPGYGSTLAEALVSEGLADAFAAELLPSIPEAPWTAALTRDQMRSLWPAVEAELASTTYDHGRWFRGHGDVPRWSGYAIGFDAVRAYLRAGGTRTPSPSVDASVVLDSYSP